LSAVYLYGITDSTRAVPDGVRLLAVDGVAGVYRPAPEEEERPTEDALWGHEEVVEALMEDGAVLPARFGTVVPSLERLRDELESRRAEFLAALDRVRGCVELGVRAAWPERTFESTGAEPGRTYLARKLDEQQAGNEAVAELHEPLARLAVDSTVEISPTPYLGLVGSYLVERDAVSRFREEAERLAKDLDGLRLACTGPWPPYSFAERRAS
jgi:hypothetical protein